MNTFYDMRFKFLMLVYLCACPHEIALAQTFEAYTPDAQGVLGSALDKSPADVPYGLPDTFNFPKSVEEEIILPPSMVYRPRGEFERPVWPPIGPTCIFSPQCTEPEPMR